MAGMEFPCESCGAKLKFAPGTTSLKCPYCGHENPIPAPDEVQAREAVAELDLQTALEKGETGAEAEKISVIKCNSCGAEFQLDPKIQSSQCPFCASPIVLEPKQVSHLRPKSLLPFAIDAKGARDRFKTWLSGLWFAPNDVKAMATTEGGFTGMYVPYWTYDADTASTYTGERGITYTRQVPTTVNGKTQMRTVTETRWTPVSGAVSRDFDDVLVIASESLPKAYAEALEPWDLEKLLPYDERYLSGFGAENYRVDLAAGFERAKGKMDAVIRGDVRQDIGGNSQRIHSLDTSYYKLTYKHVLLPIWINSYRYSGKTYTFVINGRTGEVQGQRPWSWIKIGLLAALAVVVIVVVFWLTRE
jgi:DNA-directed RNA polymerase subunit RPC12/RpoP